MDENMVKVAGKKSMIGIVESDKMDKTVVVKVMGKKKHPVIGKYITFSKSYKAHDEKNEAKVGDTVEIVETRPLSKDKYFRVLRIVERAK